MESDITNEGEDSINIIVYIKGCIHCNDVDNNPRFSDFSLKGELEIFIEGVIMTISRGGRLSRSGGCYDTSNRKKTRLRSLVTWMERWFG